MNTFYDLFCHFTWHWIDQFPIWNTFYFQLYKFKNFKCSFNFLKPIVWDTSCWIKNTIVQKVVKSKSAVTLKLELKGYLGYSPQPPPPTHSQPFTNAKLGGSITYHPTPTTLKRGLCKTLSPSYTLHCLSVQALTLLLLLQFQDVFSKVEKGICFVLKWNFISCFHFKFIVKNCQPFLWSNTHITKHENFKHTHT